MAYASQVGRARVSARNPKSLAVCQRCGIWYNRVDLKFQMDWRGAQLQNLYILVCNHCYDEPQQQLRAITLPADPVPIYYPSVEDFATAETDYRSLAEPTVLDPRTGIPIPSEILRTTENCENRTTIPYGSPDGLNQNAIMPLSLEHGQPKAYGIVLPVLSVFALGTLVTVTCSAVHNLQPNDQISIEGLTAANGFYSVQVPTATQFTYQTVLPVSPQLTGGVRIATAQVGLPLNYVDLPIPGAP